jgi:homoserine kinase
VIVRVPASSANLGPGFDTLGMAVSRHAEVGFVDDGLPQGARVADIHHPASIAFARNGGTRPIWVRTDIPMARGLGYSGAVRVAGAAAAHLERAEGDSRLRPDDRAEIFAVAAELEGHADNAAASVYGGVVATAAGRAIPLPMAFDPAVVVWVPSTTTRTDTARAALPGTVDFADAAFNVARVSLLIAALCTGDTAALRDATADRLHQSTRLAAASQSGAALDAALCAGAWCAWLSGSGPTVAALCSPDRAASIAAALPEGGVASVLRIDHEGLTIEAG